MSKEKKRTAQNHKDNYRRGGLKIANIGGKFLSKQIIAPTEIMQGLGAFPTLQGGENMNGMNNPLGALSALAGLAQGGSDPMSAFSALAALSGKANAPTSGASSGGNPADLLNLLSSLKQPTNNSTRAATSNNIPPNNNMNNNNMNNNNQNEQNNAANNYRPNSNQNRQSQYPDNRNNNQTSKSNLRQRVMATYNQEPETPCEHCDEPCVNSFRNYPSWSQVNSQSAPWKRKS